MLLNFRNSIHELLYLSVSKGKVQGMGYRTFSLIRCLSTHFQDLKGVVSVSHLTEKIT